MTFAKTLEEAIDTLNAAIPEMKEVLSDADTVVAVPLKEYVALHVFREVTLATEGLREELEEEKNRANGWYKSWVEARKQLDQAKGGEASV